MGIIVLAGTVQREVESSSVSIKSKHSSACQCHNHTHAHTEAFQMLSEDKEDESGRWSEERQVTFRAQSEHVMTRHKDTCQPQLWQQLECVSVCVCVCTCERVCVDAGLSTRKQICDFIYYSTEPQELKLREGREPTQRRESILTF